MSKRWRSVLSSDAVIAQALLQTKEFLALDSQDIEAAIPIFRWRRNLESARPFEKIFVPWLKSTVARQVQCNQAWLSWEAEFSICAQTLELTERGAKVQDWFIETEANVSTY